MVAWNLTRRCNLECAHCYIAAGPHESATSELSTGECLRIAREILAVNPSPLFILSGGEPLPSTVRELFADTPGVQPALDALGFEGLYDELVEVLRHLTVDVDDQGRATTVQVRVVVQARLDGARRTPLIVTLDEAGRGPRFLPTVGCRLGRQRTDLATGVFSAELLIKIGQQDRSSVEVGVPDYARTAGSPTGAKPSVIWRAVKDFWLLRLRLWANTGRARKRGRPILGE